MNAPMFKMLSIFLKSQQCKSFLSEVLSDTSVTKNAKV